MIKKVLTFVIFALLSNLVWAQPSGLPVDLPREELFIADQIFRYPDSGNYNLWSGGQTPHRHALMMETLWYRDQETGVRLMGAAASDPVYNDDFTQMTVSLRDNLYWSDGVQFTADDLIFTAQTINDTEGLIGSGAWKSQLNQYMASVEKLDDFTVQFTLSESNPRFHNIFETRWNGMYLMPKHALENIDNIVTDTLGDPVVLGVYVPIQADPTGYWEVFERRDDWERTPAGIETGNPGPQYIMTIFYGDSTKKAIAMSRHELDVYFDADYEAFQTTIDVTPSARSWYTDFPWAYPNEVSTRQFVFNMEAADGLYADKDVRWALALALDIVELQTEYIGGVAKVTPMPIPPTASLTELYLDPLEEFLQNIEIDLGDGEMYTPYDPSIPEQIASWAESQGYTVPGSPRDVFGTGWWRFDPDAAEKLLVKAGFSRNNGGDWLTPAGERWTIDIQSPPDENDAFRMANAAADMWSDFGIDVNLQGLERNVWNQNNYVGQFEVSTPWFSFAQASGDSWPETRGWHNQYYVPIGEDYRSLGGLDLARLNDPQIGEFVDAMAAVDPSSAENIQITQDLLQHITEEMYFITAISFKKFVTWDEQYWTGFPTSENPDYQPLYWFQAGKFAFQNLRPTQ
ncbi:MAG: ABC transporter substrate-binding protein [Deinococcota bacterium]